MQRVSDIIDRTYKGFGKVIKVRNLWSEIVGEVLSSHTEPVQIKGKTLLVLCDSPAWVQQMDILSITLMQRIQEIGKIKVDRIEAKFGLKRNPAPKKKEKKTFGRLDIDPADVERIANPGLRNAIKKLIEG